jgi:transposase-like protein
MDVEIKGVERMARQSKLAVGQRVEVVLSMLRKDEPIATLARRYNVSETTLHRWREEFLAGGQAALADRRSRKAGAQVAEIARLKKELARRDQVIGEITIANRILKKNADDLL